MTAQHGKKSTLYKYLQQTIRPLLELICTLF